MKKQKPSSIYHRFFLTASGEQEFMYYVTTQTKAELKPHITRIKRDGDLYRVTRSKHGYTLWDGRR